jgi:hypothetical protein
VCAPMAEQVSAADPDHEEEGEDEKEDVEPHGGGPFPRDPATLHLVGCRVTRPLNGRCLRSERGR